MCCHSFIHSILEKLFLLVILAKLMNPLVVLLSLISFLLLLFLHLKPAKSKKPNLPPCPPKLPILGNLHQLGAHPHRSLATLARKHGPVMHVQLGRHVPALIISSASAAEKIMKTHDLIFSSRPQSSIADRLMYGCKDMSFAPYGEYWRQIRRICVVHLLSSKRVQSFRLVREEEVANMVAELRNLSSSSGGGLVNLSEALVSLTNNVVCRVAFGRKFDGGAKNRFHAMLTEFLVLLGTFDVGDFIPSLAWVSGLNGFNARVKKCFEEFDTFFERVIDEHVQHGRDSGGVEGGNILDVLLALQNDDPSVGVVLSRDSIKALILDMFAAGTDTVHTVIDWAMAELIKHPNMMMKARDEVDRTIRTESMIKEDDTEKMSYLKMIIKEVLRLHPPLPLLVPRESTEEIELSGYSLPTKMRVFINAWAIGRDTESWKDPEDFFPERFANIAVDFEGKDFELIPFGAGRRGCPGIHFATPTIYLALASLLRHFDWELPEGRRGEELDMEEGTGLTIHRKSRLLVIAKPRLA
ncbi:Cytochrome P450 71A1 [Acorus gramineus]|uniref:Cytochrome P450 71A1 n=1 Tax=Acorus gramineus TaxID=55184 RepID=A0AAV9B791_ACOGR|nr:Cytochrome P450 71A1 [Acorus gramineus]